MDSYRNNCQLLSTLFEMTAMPFPCYGILVVVGNLPRIFPVLQDKFGFSDEDMQSVPQARDNGNDFSFPVPSPFLKSNDNDVNSFLNGYPIF